MNTHFGWKVRPAVESDIDAIVMMADASPTAPHWLRSVYLQAVDEATVPSRITLVAEAELSEPGGFVVASLMPPEAELESIVVAAAFQRQGVGSVLVGALFDVLRIRAVSTVHLEVRESNLAALALYAAAGFTKSGLRPRYYADPVEDGVLFSLELG